MKRMIKAIKDKYNVENVILYCILLLFIWNVGSTIFSIINNESLINSYMVCSIIIIIGLPLGCVFKELYEYLNKRESDLK